MGRFGVAMSSRRVVWVAWILVGAHLVAAQAKQCTRRDDHIPDLDHDYETCAQCLRETGDKCGWCPEVKQTDKGKKVVGCVPVAEAATCKATFEKGLTKTTNTTVSVTKDSVESISPSYARVDARPNVKVEVKFKAKKNEVPVEIYFLMDQSRSMTEERDTLSKLSKKIGEKVQQLAPEGYKLGFGAFFEKPIPPFSQRLENRNYDFVHYLSMTNDLNKFEKSVRESEVVGNHDTPEAGLDALMQVILCKEQIGWSDDVTHIIILLTDAPYHFAGDGILAGIWKPYDTSKCSLEKDRTSQNYVYNSLNHDYPSLSEVNYFLAKEKKNLIFGTSEVVTKLYEDLGKTQVITSTAGHMGDGRPGSEDTMLKLITNEYEKIKDSIKIKTEVDDDLITIKVDSNCNQPKEEKNSFTCDGIKVKEIVDFTATIEMKPEICDKPKDKYSLSVEVFGQPHSKLTIDLKPICECDCGKANPLPDRFGRCKAGNSNGIQCGACDCKSGFSGDICQCEKGTAGDDQGKCMDKENRECGGHGNCECGECKCNSGYSGQYCQCELKSCKNKYKDCNGNGHCQCEGVSTEAKCKCNSGWEGDTCACKTNEDGSPNEEQCKDPFSSQNEVCNGDLHGGSCQCLEDGRRCHCSAISAVPSGYKGDFCQKHPTNADKDACDKAEPCVLLKVFGKSVGEGQREEWKAKCEVNLEKVLRCKKIYTDRICNDTLLEEENDDQEIETPKCREEIKDIDLYENECEGLFENDYEEIRRNHHSPCSTVYAGCSFDYYHDGILDYSYNNRDKAKNVYIRFYEDSTRPNQKKRWSPINCSSFSLEYTVGITVGVLLFIGAVLFFVYAIIINLRDKWEYERFLAMQQEVVFDDKQTTIYQGSDSGLKQRLSRMSFR